MPRQVWERFPPSLKPLFRHRVDGEARDKSDCHFRKTVTEYGSKSVIEWTVSCIAKWQSDMTAGEVDVVADEKWVGVLASTVRVRSPSNDHIGRIGRRHEAQLGKL